MDIAAGHRTSVDNSHYRGADHTAEGVSNGCPSMIPGTSPIGTVPLGTFLAIPAGGATPISAADVMMQSFSDAAGVAGALSVTDASAASIGDISALSAFLGRADALNAGIADTLATLASAIVTSDNLSISANDAYLAAQIIAVASDTVWSAIVEVALVLDITGNIPISATDQIAMVIGDAIANLFSTLTAIDGLALSVAEVRTMLAAVAATDALRAVITDGAAALLTVMAGNDTLGLSVNDSTALLLALIAVNDNIGLALADAANLFAAVSRADSGSLSMAEAAQAFALIAALESLTASMSDSSITQTIGAIIGRLRARIETQPGITGALTISGALTSKLEINIP